MGNTRGFTLLEAMIAITIMALGVTSILSIENSSIRATTRAKEMNTIAMLTRRAMGKMEQEFEGKKFTDVKKEWTGDFEKPFDEYLWAAKIKEVKFPNLNLAPPGKEGEKTPGSEIAEQMTKLLTKFLSDSIREVVVTVKSKPGGTERVYTVSQYWVDLTHEFSLSE